MTRMRKKKSIPQAGLLFLSIFSVFSLFGGDLDLVQQQKRELARRRACAASKRAVNDWNMNAVSIPGLKYHFSQLEVDPPLPSGNNPASLDMTAGGYSVISESKWAYRKRERERMENEIAEAEANIRHWDAQWRTLQMDCAPYAIPDKEGYIKKKSEELERWIEGERYFIHLARKRLAGL